MTIKRLRSENKEELEEVTNKFTFKDKLCKNIQQFLENPLNYFLVAYEENNPNGYLLGYELLKPDSIKPRFMIYDIEVLEKYRRQGIGKNLIVEFLKICKNRNGSEVFVPTNKSNSAAMKLYASTGGKQVVEDDVIIVYEIGGE